MSNKYKGLMNIILKLMKYIILICGSLLMIIPLIWTLSTSLSPDSIVISYGLFPKEITFSNYIEAWEFSTVFDETVTMGRFLLNSFIVTASITIGGIFVDSMAGYVLAKRNIPGKDILFYLALITLMIPFYVICVPLFLLARDFGWLNSYIGQIVPFLASGFGVFMFRQFFQTIPKEVEDSAKIDGCSLLRTYISIMLPMAKPVIGAMTIFKAMWAWNQFFWPLLIINDIRMKPLSLALEMFRGINTTQWGLLSAGMVISIIPIIIVYLSMQNMFHKGITMGAVKG